MCAKHREKNSLLFMKAWLLFPRAVPGPGWGIPAHFPSSPSDPAHQPLYPVPFSAVPFLQGTFGDSLLGEATWRWAEFIKEMAIKGSWLRLKGELMDSSYFSTSPCTLESWMPNPTPFPSVPLSTSQTPATIWNFLPSLEPGLGTRTDGTWNMQPVITIYWIYLAWVLFKLE